MPSMSISIQWELQYKDHKPIKTLLETLSCREIAAGRLARLVPSSVAGIDMYISPFNSTNVTGVVRAKFFQEIEPDIVLSCHLDKLHFFTEEQYSKAVELIQQMFYGLVDVTDHDGVITLTSKASFAAQNAMYWFVLLVRDSWTVTEKMLWEAMPAQNMPFAWMAGTTFGPVWSYQKSETATADIESETANDIYQRARKHLFMRTLGVKINETHST